MARTSKIKKKNKKHKTADHMSTESDKSPKGVCSLFFWIFEVFAWSAPDGQNLENQKKQKKQNCRPHVHRVRQKPQWGLQFFFGFSRFLHGLLQMARTSKIKKNKKTKLQTTCPQSQTKAPMGSAVFFLDFRGFCMVCSRWPEPRKSKKNKKKTKLQITCPQSQTRAPMGSAVFFWIFEVFASPMGSAVVFLKVFAVCSFDLLFFEVFAWFASLQMASNKRDCLFIL